MRLVDKDKLLKELIEGHEKALGIIEDSEYGNINSVSDAIDVVEYADEVDLSEREQEIRIKERCRAIDDFAEMLKNRIDTNREYVIKHNMPWECANPDKCDIDEMAREIKGVPNE